MKEQQELNLGLSGNEPAAPAARGPAGSGPKKAPPPAAEPGGGKPADARTPAPTPPAEAGAGNGGDGGGKPGGAGPLPDGPLRRLFDGNFLQYASYVIRDRAIPDLDDGLKPVQRRILHSLNEMDDGRFIKVANVVGHTMQYHPHGDASIGDALVALANKEYLIERQGNYGNLLTGDPAAAPRYIECRLSELARAQLFNADLTEFVPSYDGRRKEPVALPSKLPLLLMLGAEGIAVGLSTRILPHNFGELIEAEIAALQDKPFRLYPDFPTGGLMDASGYEDGRGSVTVRSRIERVDERRLVIRELPFGATTDSVIASVEEAARKGKIRLKGISDFTAEKAEVEVLLHPEQDPDRAIEALYAFTQCQMQVSSRLVVIRGGRPAEMDVTSVVKHGAARLLDLLRRELEHERRKQMDELHRKTLVELFIEHRIYRAIEKCASQAAIQQAVFDGLAPHRERLARDVTHADVEMLLGIPIRRISSFDAEKNRREIAAVREAIARAEKNLGNLKAYAVRYLRALLNDFARDRPRRTLIKAFKEIEVRELTADELEIGHDAEKGYLGSAVKAAALFKCSSLDRLMVFWRDGRFRVMPPPEKLFVDTNMMYAAVADREKVFTVLYAQDGFTYAKRFRIGGTIMNKDYRFTPPGCPAIYLADTQPEVLFVRYVREPRLRVLQQEFQTKKVAIRDREAHGIRMTSRQVKSVDGEKPANWDDSKTGPRGVYLDLM